MNKFLVLAVVTVSIYSCKSKQDKQDTGSSFFPVLSFINSQIAQVDTSLYGIIRITKTGSLSDTQYIKREEFRKTAQEFLDIPDITSSKLRNEYVEQKIFDESLNKVILNYTTKDTGAEILRQEVLIQPNPMGDEVKTIFIDRVQRFNDSTVQKKMSWQVNKWFQVTTITQKGKQPEKVQTVEVIWNDISSAE
ncbi:MAG: hypothetical protein ABR502_01935 [Chitinophagaceae bacterium]